MKITFLSLLITFLSVPAMAQEDPTDPPQMWSQKELGVFITDYLMNNPQVLLDSVDQYARTQAEQAEARANDLVRENSDVLFRNAALPEIGNPQGDVTMVEFLDYNCGYCKNAMEDVFALIGEDENVRVILVDIPILGPASTAAAKWALAAQKQGWYMDYHIALMEHSGRLDVPQLVVIANRLGLDVDRLRADAESEAVLNQIGENIELARRLGIRGTPAFVVEDTLVRGYVGLDGLKQAVADARLGGEEG